nr:leucine-rich repeat protein [Treponema sp.]
SFAGLPSLSGASYEWQVGDMAVALTDGAVTSVGEAATITPAAPGNTTVTLTASFLGVSSTSSLPLKVAGLKLYLTPGGAAAGDVVMKLSDTSGVTRYASVVNGSGTETLAWNITEGSSVSIPGGATGGSLTITPAAGGKSVVTVSTNVNGRTLSKKLVVYVFDIALSGGTALKAPTLTVPNYNLMMTTADTAGKTITASLNGSGMPAVTYSWTCADPALNYIMMDDSNSTSGTFTVKPKAAGTTSFSVMAYYNGSLTPVCSKTVDVTVAGVTITGSPVVKKGGTAVTLGATVQGFTTTPTVSSWSWAWKAGAASLATITSPASSTPSLTSATAGGKSTLTVSAVVGGVTLTAEKDIYVLELEVSAPAGCETDASGNPKLNYDGTLDLTASLTGLTAADLAVLGTLSYSWSSGDATATPPVPERASFSPDNKAATAVSPISGGTAPVPLTVTLSWTGNATAGISAASMDASIDVSIPAEVALASLADYLASLPVNDKDTPYKIPNITGLVSSGMSDTALPCQLDVLKTCGRYLDLSGLTLTEDNVLSYVTAFGSYKLPAYASDQLFRDNKYIVSPPVISQPSGGLLHVGKEFWGCTALETIPAGTITNAYYLEYTFEDCKNLTDASGLGISPQVYNMFECFYNCKNLTTLPSIPTSVATYPMNMQKCFYGCESLQDASSLTIATSQNMDLKQCFYGCKKLTTPPAIQDTNSSKSVDMTSCFEGCEKLTAFPTLTISGTVNLNSCFKGCKALTSSSTITMPSRITDMTSCFEGCTALNGKTFSIGSGPTDAAKWANAFKGLTGVTVQIWSSDCTLRAAMKAAIEAASGNSGVTVVFTADPAPSCP